MPLPPGFVEDAPQQNGPPAGFTEDPVDNPPPGIPFGQRGIGEKLKILKAAMKVRPDVAPSPTEMIQKGLNTVGEKEAELGGRMGLPEAGAALGTATQMAPDILASITGLHALENSEEPLAQAIRNTPSDLSPRYDELHKAAGISQDLPIRRGTIPKFPGLNGLPANVPPPQAPAVAPNIYPKDMNSFLNFARARLEGLGSQLSPQELNDYKTMIGTAMRNGDLVPGTAPYAIASKVNSQATGFLNDAVPGRADLDQIYALSKKLRIAPEIAKQIWSYIGPKMRWGAGVVGLP